METRRSSTRKRAARFLVLFVLTVLVAADPGAAYLHETPQGLGGHSAILDAPVDSRAPSTGTVENAAVLIRFSDDAVQRVCVPAESEAHVYLDGKE